MYFLISSFNNPVCFILVSKISGRFVKLIIFTVKVLLKMHF